MSVGAIARTSARFGQGTGPIFFDDLRCTGLEYRVFDCPSRGIEVSSGCGHSEDAGVTCVAGKILLNLNFSMIPYFQVAHMEKSDWWEGPTSTKVVWRSV